MTVWSVDTRRRTLSNADPLNSDSQAINVEMPFTVILDDPMANSFVQSLYAPDPDPQLSEESYDRSHEQNEELGLNDIQTENYGPGEFDDSVEEKKE